MQKLVKLVVFLAVVYAAYSIGWPWLQGFLNRSHVRLGGSAGPEASCLDAAQDAVDYFNGRIRDFVSPPMGADAWTETMSKTRGQIAAARKVCRCDHEACREGRRVLTELDSAVSEFDGNVQVRHGLPGDSERRVETLYSTLERGRDLLP